MANDKKILVTSPLLPNLDEMHKLMEDIWERKWITNSGYYHNLLEQELTKYLGVDYLSLFTNGTLPLITALQALGLDEGEVITTPYSFVATTHAIWWNKLTPVFVDIDPVTGCIDPDKIEAAITDKTVAIMPVHVYGTPCDVERIQQIADKYNLKVIYDAAHAFGVTKDGVSILKAGDISTLSFHATKTYNTVEGGALVCNSAEMKYHVDNLKNFGFRGETNVVGPGINSKMDEIRAAYGLLNLKHVDAAIAARKEVAKQYVEVLKDVKGIGLYQPIADYFKHSTLYIQLNFSYFPIFINAAEYGMTRDELYENMRANNVLGRRYFYPLISTFTPYNTYPSATNENLPVATQWADTVICLPMHHALSEEDVRRVVKCITEK